MYIAYCMCFLHCYWYWSVVKITMTDFQSLLKRSHHLVDNEVPLLLLLLLVMITTVDLHGLEDTTTLYYQCACSSLHRCLASLAYIWTRFIGRYCQFCVKHRFTNNNNAAHSQQYLLHKIRTSQLLKVYLGLLKIYKNVCNWQQNSAANLEADRVRQKHLDNLQFAKCLRLTYEFSNHHHTDSDVVALSLQTSLSFKASEVVKGLCQQQPRHILIFLSLYNKI